MQQVVHKQQVNRFDVDLDTQLNQLLTILEKENALLTSLIERRSKMLTESPAAGGWHRWIMSALV
jgi:hypothetical protein